jgi:Cys-tRNA(Pro) deacylase
MSKTTRATQTLTQLGVAFTLYAYDYDPEADSIGLQAAAALGAEPRRVLKTLMAEVDGKPVCVIVPSDREVSMKKLANAFGGKAAKMMRDAKNGDAKAMSTLLDAYHHGILSGLFQGDVQEMANVIAKAGSKRSLAGDRRFIALYAKITQDINRNRENWGRLTHYLYRRQAQGMSITDAAKHVRAAHFDYEELTPFERNVMKSIAPFYTWTRKNIPFQVKALLGAPGRMATFPKLAIESQNAANPSGQEGIQPDYLRDNLAFQVPGTGGKFINPMIGITDLSRLDPHQLRQTFASMVSPAVSVPYELAANKNLYTGQPISPDKHTRVPINDRYAGLLKLLPGADVGLTQRNGTFGAGANPKLMFMLGQIPALQATLNAGGKIKGKNQSEAARMLAYGTGINLQKVDEAQQEGLATVEERDAFAKWVAGLKDSNPELFKLLKTKRKKSAHQKLLDTALIKAQSGR